MEEFALTSSPSVSPNTDPSSPESGSSTTSNASTVPLGSPGSGFLFRSLPLKNLHVHCIPVYVTKGAGSQGFGDQTPVSGILSLPMGSIPGYTDSSINWGRARVRQQGLPELRVNQHKRAAGDNNAAKNVKRAKKSEVNYLHPHPPGETTETEKRRESNSSTSTRRGIMTKSSPIR